MEAKYEKHAVVGMEESGNKELVEFVLKELKQGLLQPLLDVRNGESKVICFTNVSTENCDTYRSRIYKQALIVDDLVLCHECEPYDERCHWCNKYHAPMFPNDFCSRGRKREK
jgi:hypothetical protein